MSIQTTILAFIAFMMVAGFYVIDKRLREVLAELKRRGVS
jgi:hypothetical protein